MVGKLLLFACLVLIVDSAVHKLKVNTLPGKVSRLLKEGKLEEFKTQHKKAVDFHLQKRLHRPSTRASRLGKSQTVDEYSYYTYTVNVTIGTPPQPFQLYLNTYDDSIWVPDISCPDDSCGCDGESERCYIKNKFDRRESTTFKTDNKSFSDYDMGGTGIFANDTIGLVPGIQVQNATFGLEDNPASYLNMYPFDGYLSLSFKIEDGTQKPIVEQAFDQKLIDAPIFTFFLKGDGFKINDQPGGQITFGGVDTENCSPDVGYVPVYNQEDWVFDVLKTEISRKTKGGTWTGAVGSEGTSIIIPQQAFNDLSSTTNAVFDSNNGYYSVDCGVKFEWTVTLANQNKLTITEKKGVTQINDVCYLLFEPLSEGYSEFFFGGAFIHSYCQVFDMTGKIGFSKVLDN